MSGGTRPSRTTPFQSDNLCHAIFPPPSPCFSFWQNCKEQLQLQSFDSATGLDSTSLEVKKYEKTEETKSGTKKVCTWSTVQNKALATHLVSTLYVHCGTLSLSLSHQLLPVCSLFFFFLLFDRSGVISCMVAPTSHPISVFVSLWLCQLGQVDRWKPRKERL